MSISLLSTIDIQISYQPWAAVMEACQNELAEICEACLQDEYNLGFPQLTNSPQNTSYELSITLVNNDEIQSLNKEWRQKDKPTNILSFSALEGQNIFIPHEPAMLGDLVIAYEIVKEEAIAANISFIEHLKRLIIHGLFHLFGYDHITDEEFKDMAAREYKLLMQFHIHDYIDDLTID